MKHVQVQEAILKGHIVVRKRTLTSCNAKSLSSFYSPNLSEGHRPLCQLWTGLFAFIHAFSLLEIALGKLIHEFNSP